MKSWGLPWNSDVVVSCAFHRGFDCVCVCGCLLPSVMVRLGQRWTQITPVSFRTLESLVILAPSFVSQTRFLQVKWPLGSRASSLIAATSSASGPNSTMPDSTANFAYFLAFFASPNKL